MHRVGRHETDVLAFADDGSQRGEQRPVELDRGDATAGVRERQGERAEAGADLDHRIPRTNARVQDDGTGEVRVREEVLTERLRGPDVEAVGERPERRAPRGSVTR
jgi:hypothetical protein